MMSDVARTARVAADAGLAQPVISILGIDGRTVFQAAALLRAGFRVICADSDIDKVETLAQRIALGIDTAAMAVLRAGQARGNLMVIDDIFAAVLESGVTFICQGPGTDFLGQEDTHALKAIGRTIGAAIALKGDFHVVVQQADILPDLTRSILIPAIEAASGERSGMGFGLCHASGALDAAAQSRTDGPLPARAGDADDRAASCLDAILGQLGAAALSERAALR